MTTSSPLAQAQTRWWAPPRIITATACYDGHDAAIQMIRRLLIEAGAEVIHLGHNRRADELVSAALQEDCDAIAVSSYQGGHMAYFGHLVDSLKLAGAADIRVFGGGGGTITQTEARRLEQQGVTRIYTTEDGLRLGLEGMIGEMLAHCQGRPHPPPQPHPGLEQPREIARALGWIEQGVGVAEGVRRWRPPGRRRTPLVGITGPGGAGKSSLLDELLQRLFGRFPDLAIACLSIDPSRRRGGGALLGDRLRLNQGARPGLFFHSLATRCGDASISGTLPEACAYLRRLGFDLILIETAGSGQGESGITGIADLTLYVMSDDYGAPSQLEKTDMLGLADLIALNKADRPGARDALEEIRRRWREEHPQRRLPDPRLPVYATQANHHGDPGIDALCTGLCERLAGLTSDSPWRRRKFTPPAEPTGPLTPPIPLERRQYLAQIAARGRREIRRMEAQAVAAAAAQHHYNSLRALADPWLPPPLSPYREIGDDPALGPLRRLYNQTLEELQGESLQLLREWPGGGEEGSPEALSQADDGPRTLSGTPLPRVALPRLGAWGERLRFLLQEQRPGHYPFTAGCYPGRQDAEEPTRMFAGEGNAERTNRRFHYLLRDQRACRLSTAFDPVTLYGEDPQASPDLYGCIGMSGVSSASLDDFKRLYSGIDLAHPETSVSLTINGPGPVVLACFLNTAIDQRIERWLRQSGQWQRVERRLQAEYADRPRPRYRANLPPGHDGLGLGLLGLSGKELLEPDPYRRIRDDTLRQLRGTLQADILKEDQAQNECLFPIDFALRLMGDVQAYIARQGMRHYYSVSVSGYHIAEAGANPITQLAFTLANGFTLVEYFLARGLAIDDFAPHLSFFFSNGLDAEYAVIGRVARRIWARAMRHHYRAGERAQRLKYHIQTSGRSLQDRELALNDIRTCLEALYALSDNCNSLHTNAADEALTTPTEATLRRALAIQRILRHEFGLGHCSNPLQGAYLIEQLSEQVEQAVYVEFDRLAERGGVLAAMESQYQRRRIQQEGLDYERCKSDGRLPIVGVNCFLTGEDTPNEAEAAPLVRASDAEKRLQIDDIAAFKRQHANQAGPALARLRRVAAKGGNVFSELMECVRVATLGQITQTLYAVAGRYRRSL